MRERRTPYPFAHTQRRRRISIPETGIALHAAALFVLLQYAPVRGALTAAAQVPHPIHLRTDRTTPYQAIAEVLADSAAAGTTRIGFVSEPEATARR